MQKILKNENMPDNFFINVPYASDESILDLFHVTHETIRSEMLHIMQNYLPQKIKTTDMIQLKYETPVPPHHHHLAGWRLLKKFVKNFLSG